MNRIKKITLFAVTAIAAMGIASITSSHTASKAPTDQEAFCNAAESTINGVVSVKSYATPRRSSYGGGNFFDDPFMEFFFGAPSSRQQSPQQQQSPERQRQIGLGSGVIISKDGYIVTNNHVIADAERLEVTLNDNRNYEAIVIGTDPATDIALIKIEADDLHVIPMGDSEKLRVGEWVLAVGNPFGFTSTVTSGIVSAKGRNISSTVQSTPAGNIESYIQTDAALNAGNSGGALVNLNGELIGINTAIYSQTGNYAGCSFAVPVSIVKKVVDDLRQYGAVQRAVLGIRFTELTPEMIREQNISGVNAGIYVASVEEQSAALEAGIEKGDIIIAINGTSTLNTAQLQEAIAKCSPGDRVEMTIVRDGKKLKKTVTLRNSQGTTRIARATSLSDLGCTFSKVSDETKSQLGISRGVEITHIENGPFKDAGMREGFIILTINESPIKSADDIERIYKGVVKDPKADKVLFIKGIEPSGRPGYFAVKVDD